MVGFCIKLGQMIKCWGNWCALNNIHFTSISTCVPVFNDGVGWLGIGVVVRWGSAGLHKHLGVVDYGGRIYLHVNLLPYVVLQRVRTGINDASELVVGVKLKLVGERAEAFIKHFHHRPVCCEAQWHVPLFGVLTVELYFQVMFPGDQSSAVIHCGDFILENEMFLVLLQSQTSLCQSSFWYLNQQQQNRYKGALVTSIWVPQALRGMTPMMWVLLEYLSRLQRVLLGSLRRRWSSRSPRRDDFSTSTLISDSVQITLVLTETS